MSQAGGRREEGGEKLEVKRISPGYQNLQRWFGVNAILAGFSIFFFMSRHQNQYVYLHIRRFLRRAWSRYLGPDVLARLSLLELDLDSQSHTRTHIRILDTILLILAISKDSRI